MDEGELFAAVDASCGRALMAISASTETSVEAVGDEPEAEPADEEEPEVVIADLAAIDWLDQTWTTDCTNDEGLRGVELTRDDELDGAHRPEDGQLTPVYVVELDSAVYGDVTGDGHDEAIFVTQCVLASAEYRVEVWSHDEQGKPLHLPPVHRFFKFDAVVDRAEAVNGLLRIHSNEGESGDDMPHLNGYPVQVVTDWTYEANNQEWLAAELSRTDTSPAAPEQTTVLETAGFVLPSDNIYCLSLPPAWTESSEPLLECRIDSGLNPEPSEACWGGEGGDWAGMHLPGNEPGEPSCFSDALRQEVQDNWVLDYGATWRQDGFECSSSEQGLRCSNPSGNGLELARNSWSAW